MGSPPYGLPADGGRSLFRRVAPLLTGDVVLANLEGTLTRRTDSKCGSGGPNCFAFRTPPSYARWLRRAGITTVTLANNHGYDFGAGGLRDTIAAVRRAGVLPTGWHGAIAYPRVAGTHVAVVGFAPNSHANSLLDLRAARALVRKATRRASIVIVTFHGGAEGRDAQGVRPGTETFLGENRGDVVRFARMAVNAGADLVVGHGPHVLRGMEFHRGRLIAYSMGNFMGYAVFSLGGPLSESAVLQVTLDPDGRFRSGRLRPVTLQGAGVPEPGGTAVRTVAALSRRDLGARRARLRADGTIATPR